MGDSTAWTLTKGRWQHLFGSTEDGDVVSPATRALPVQRDGAEVASVVLGPSDALILMTDGVSLPLGDGMGEVGRYLAEAWAGAPDLLSFATHVQFQRRSFDDDRTVVAVWVTGLSQP